MVRFMSFDKCWHKLMKRPNPIGVKFHKILEKISNSSATVSNFLSSNVYTPGTKLKELGGENLATGVNTSKVEVNILKDGALRRCEFRRMITPVSRIRTIVDMLDNIKTTIRFT